MNVGLVELRIANVAVVREARIEPGPDFTVVTGETGAGKSVCMTALRLALGGRTDADVVRAGADSARVVAVFDGVPGELRARCDELGIPADELLSLSREVPRRGRSTARVNGALVSQATLAEIGEALAEVTVQGASQRLLERGWQRTLLDGYAGGAVRTARTAVAGALAALREARSDLEQARREAASGAHEVDEARALIEELGPLELIAGEDTALVAEATRLRHAVGIAAAAEAVRVAAGGGDDTVGSADLLAAAVEEARPLAGVDPGLRAVVDGATAMVHALRDLAGEARRCSESVALDEERLAAVEERLDVLARVRRRHGSLDGALAALAAAESVEAGAEGRSDDLSRLQERVASATAEVVRAARELTAERTAAAGRLEAAVTERLRLLELPHARFRICLHSTPDPAGIDLGGGAVRCTSQGADDVEFRLTANRGADPRPLDAGPSGGELSRLALAVGSLAGSEGPVLVLDEVDTGISGETAARVGDVLAEMGADRQVIAVTHRSEIAARAGRHLLAVKGQGRNGAETRIGTLTGEDRTREIARLMSGRTTEAALVRATELLVEGASTVAAPARG